MERTTMIGIANTLQYLMTGGVVEHDNRRWAMREDDGRWLLGILGTTDNGEDVFLPNDLPLSTFIDLVASMGKETLFLTGAQLALQHSTQR